LGRSPEKQGTGYWKVRDLPHIRRHSRKAIAEKFTGRKKLQRVVTVLLHAAPLQFCVGQRYDDDAGKASSRSMTNNKTTSTPFSVRQQYETHGVAGYYEEYGADYHNPHEAIIAEVLRLAVTRWQLDLTAVLDLACGSGEVTLALRSLGAGKIDGVDPYTGAAYLARTGQTAAALRFEDIAVGALQGQQYTLMVCSFALHLLPVSWLPAVLAQLRENAACLLLLTPHKRPVIRPEWGWQLHDEFVLEKVRARCYYRL
jgi:Methyltransferase domain